MRRSISLSVLLTTTLLVACNDAPTAPSGPQVAGTYSATTFTVTTVDTTFDLLAGGSSLTLVLKDDGTTTGTLVIEETSNDLTGDWDTVADTLHLNPATGNLLAQIPFTIHADRLEADQVLNSFVFHITLQK